ncbi:MAG: hypothetical protein ABEK04_04635 [Candidatus Nanohalobium sp.]
MTLQEYEVKRVEPFSLGKISAAFTALLGLISGLLYLPFAAFMMVGGFGVRTLPAILGSLLVGLLIVVFVSVVYAGFGFAFGVFYGYVYNYISKEIGGFEMVMDVEG